tara:strand:- start:13519 stop:14799 length:1281 start_codon:yes stop_codon:yes gene_type:complete
MAKKQLVLAALAVAGLMLSSRAAAQEQFPSDIDLDRAIELARSNNSVLLGARHRIAEARGNLTAASVLLATNPQLAARAGQRGESSTGSSSNFEFEVELQQKFEIGGQRRQRIGRAKAQLQASEQSTQDVFRVVELAVATAFFEGIAAQRRVQIREESLRLAERLFDVAAKRLERGAGVPLDVNTARIRRAEAKRRLLAANSNKRSVLLRLQMLLGLPATRDLALKGSLPVAQPKQNGDALVMRALEKRPDLRALTRQIEAAKATVLLADAEAWPDVSVGVSYGVEEDVSVVMGGIRFTLPVFNRNKGERKRARAALNRMRAASTSRKIGIESELRQALLSYEQARSALELYDDEVLDAQEESLKLLQGAFQAGDIGIPDVIVLQREILESREGYLNVRLALAQAHAAVLAAAALPQTTTQKVSIP